ncbi:hypothetical protein VR010_02285 [Actinomycetaceae bacterium L2_0104]
MIVHTRKRIVPMAVLMVGALLLGACGGEEPQESPTTSSASTASESPTPTTPEPVDPSTSVEEPTSPSEPTPSSAPPTDPEVPVPGAYPGAGGPIPNSSVPLEGSPETATAALYIPGDNGTCVIAETGVASCLLQSYVENAPYGYDETGQFANAVVHFDEEGMATIESFPDLDGSYTPQTVGEGGVVHYGDFVCASHSGNLTCWNARTGHGALITSEEFTAF